MDLKRFRTYVHALCIVVLLAGTSGICHAQSLLVGALDFPPYYVVKSQNDVSGIYIDFLKDLIARSGFEFKIEGYPPARLYKDVGDGTVNIWMGTVGVKAYEGKTLVSPKITDIRLRVYTVGDKPLLKTKAELNGKKLISIHGYNYGGFIKYLKDPANQITLDPSRTHENAFKKLKMHRADYVLDYKLPSETTLKKISVPDIKFSEIMTIGIYINISKATPNAQAVLDKLMESYNQMKAENKLPF